MREENNDRVNFPDRLQKNSMLPFHATNNKYACTKHCRQQEPIGNMLPLEVFRENYLCNFNGFYIPSALLFFLYRVFPPQKLMNV